MTVHYETRDHSPQTTLGRIGSALCAMVIFSTAGSGADAAVVDLDARSFARTTIAAIYDENGYLLDGPVSDYFEQDFSGSELAIISSIFVLDEDGNDRFSPSTVDVDFGGGFSSASFLDPDLIYGGDVFGDIALIETYENISGMVLEAVFNLDYNLSASVEINEPAGKGRATASLSATGQILRLGAFSDGLDLAVSAGKFGVGTDSEAVLGTEVYSVRFEPGDRMEWILLLRTNVNGSYTPIPLPGGLPLLAGGLGLAALLARKPAWLRRKM